MAQKAAVTFAAAAPRRFRIGIGLNTGLTMAGAVGGPHRINHTVIDTEERIMRKKRSPLLELQQQQHARLKRDSSYLDAELRRKPDAQRTFTLFKVQLLDEFSVSESH